MIIFSPGKDITFPHGARACIHEPITEKSSEVHLPNLFYCAPKPILSVGLRRIARWAIKYTTNNRKEVSILRSQTGYPGHCEINKRIICQ